MSEPSPDTTGGSAPHAEEAKGFIASVVNGFVDDIMAEALEAAKKATPEEYLALCLRLQEAEEAVAKERARAEAAEARADCLSSAILFTAELYAEPIRHTVRGKLKPNLSIGFETRFQKMYDLALDGGAP